LGLLFSTEQYTRLHVYCTLYILERMHVHVHILHTSTDGIKERQEYTRVLTCIALFNLIQDEVEYKCSIPASEWKSSGDGMFFAASITGKSCPLPLSFS
jgi:hypothetical protein